MPPLPPVRPVPRPRALRLPTSRSTREQSTRTFSISSKRICTTATPLILYERHPRRTLSPSNSALLPCITHRNYQNKYLPKKKWWQKCNTDHERNEILRKTSENATKYDIRHQHLNEQAKTNNRKNVADSIKENALTMDDFGLLEGTPVIITKADWPPLLQQPRPRLKMERHLLFRKFEERSQFFFFLVTQCLNHGFRNTLRQRLSRSEAKQAAQVLHFQMNQALADGSTESLSKYAFTGLRNEMRTLIGQRTPGTNYLWTRSGVTSTLVSHRVTKMPTQFADGGGNASFLRQAVVRIRSMQSIVEQRFGDLRVHEDMDGNEEGEEGQSESQSENLAAKGAVEEQACDELIVIQQRIKGPEVSPWRVWGMTQETTLEEWPSIEDPIGAVTRREEEALRRRRKGSGLSQLS